MASTSRLSKTLVKILNHNQRLSWKLRSIFKYYRREKELKLEKMFSEIGKIQMFSFDVCANAGLYSSIISKHFKKTIAVDPLDLHKNYWKELSTEKLTILAVL